MANIYRKTCGTVFTRKLMQVIGKLRQELNEHRYGLERSVQRETAHLLKHITLLESCNASLSSRLAMAQKELTELKQRPAQDMQLKNPSSAVRAARLYVMNSKAQQSEEANAQGHATAA